MLTQETKEKLLARHQAFIRLAHYLEGDVADYINFLKNVFLLEKNLEQDRDSGNAQCSLMGQILQTESQIKKIIFTEEWQQAAEHFSLPNNATELLDLLYQLELGNPNCSERPLQLRTKLVRQALFQNSHHPGIVAYNNTLIKFIFTADKPRWTLSKIEWGIQERQGNPLIVGEPVISLGIPNPDGPELYRYLFGVMGSERQAAAALAIRAAATENSPLREMATTILNQLPWGLEEVKGWFVDIPALQESLAQWLKLENLDREFSAAGLQFLTDAMVVCEKSNPTIYQQLKQRLAILGLSVTEAEKPSGYDFSNDVPKGNIIRTRPIVKYYWPEDDTWSPVFPGKCNFSAGPVPIFLQEIEKLKKNKQILPRPEDYDIVRDLLLFIQLGDKVPKPPILPVYNALRRWLEALAQKQDFKALENLCSYAKIFRPLIHIPTIGEKPVSIANREHKLIPKLAPEHKPGMIVGIKQAGIVIPGERMPLCLPGIYWVATLDLAPPPVTDATTTIPIGNPDQFREAWQKLDQCEQPQELLTVAKKLLQDMSNIEEKSWETIQNTMSSFNETHNPKIIFWPHRKITATQFKELETSGKYRFKIAHTNRWEEGWLLAQEPGMDQCLLIISSGIPSKIVQIIQKLHIWAKAQHYQTDSERIDLIRCNFLSFLKATPQREALGKLLAFYDQYPSDLQKTKEDREFLKNWLKQSAS